MGQKKGVDISNDEYFEFTSRGVLEWNVVPITEVKKVLT